MVGWWIERKRERSKCLGVWCGRVSIRTLDVELDNVGEWVKLHVSMAVIVLVLVAVEKNRKRG